ncbi:MAG: hypothetical protein KGZ74_07070 [Chitinophagaceae bacterium]|nr:hypothetical protein [Chitinophagaceae bacterium]
MELTLKQYLENPTGKGSAVSYIKLIKNEYDPKYEALLDLHKEFDTSIYFVKDSYYIHIKIPSETVKNVLYDVVIKFEKKRYSSSNNIKDWPIRVVCNSPSFVYTYTNVFRKNKLLIEELKYILPKKAIDEPAVVRNPYGNVGFEKTIYYACQYIKDNFSSVSILDNIADKSGLKELKSELIEFDVIMALIKKEKSEEKIKNARKRKEKEKRKRLTNTNSFVNKQSINTIVPKISAINIINGISKTNKVKSISRVKIVGKK